MKKTDLIPFTKMSGTGNDFIVFDNRDGRFAGDESAFFSAVCRRGHSVGADGVILADRGASAPVRMRYFNADGGAAAFCANGARCAARFAFEKGFTEERRFILEASDGSHEMEVRAETVRLRMAEPVGLKLPAARCAGSSNCIFELLKTSGGPSIREKPVAWSGEAGESSICREETSDIRSLTPRQVFNNAPIKKLDPAKRAAENALANRFTASPAVAVDPRFREAGFINTGVPHLVLFLDDEAALEALDIEAEAPFYRHHPAFPGGTNVNFAARTADGSIRVRTFERGVEGETLSCGTGCTAAALIASRAGRTAPPVSVRTRGGLLTVDFDSRWETVVLSGPAVTVFEGVLLPASWSTEP